MGTDNWVQCNDAPVKICTYPVTGLFEGRSYEFRVRAVNSAGVSRPSRASGAVAALDPADLRRLQGGSPACPVPAAAGSRGSALGRAPPPSPPVPNTLGRGPPSASLEGRAGQAETDTSPLLFAETQFKWCAIRLFLAHW